MSKKQSFLKGATILGIAGIIIKIMGAAFKVPLFNLIGDEGSSYYNAPYQIYNWLLVISTAGIPTAIAKLIAEKETFGDTHGIFRIIQVIFKPLVLVSTLIFAILFFGAVPFSTWLGLPNAAPAFRAVAPALLFVPAMSVFRGFFQGIQRMQGFAITQIVEQLARVTVGLSLAYYFFNQSVELAAAGATFGATAGAIVGFGVSFGIYKYIKKKEYTHLLKKENTFDVESTMEILKQIVIISIPITIGASIMPTMNSVDLMIVVRRLTATGFENAGNLYGILTGFAVTIVNFPQILTASLQISLVPAVTQLYVIYTKSKEEEDRLHLEKTITAGIKSALIIGVPCAIGLVTLSGPVVMLLFSSQPEAAVIGGGILKILGWDLIFLAVYQATTGILQGLKKQMLPALHLAIGMLFKVVLTYTLVGIESINIHGAAISTVVAFAVASALNVYAVQKQTYISLNIFKIGIKPLISGLVMGTFVLVAYPIFEGYLGLKLAAVITIAIAALIYGVLIIMTKALSHEEYDMLPGGSKLKKLAIKLGK